MTAPKLARPQNQDGTYSAIENSGKIQVKNGSVDSTLVSGANVGCQVGQSCPDSKFIYKTARLDVEVFGDIEKAGQIPVKIHPSMLFTTGLDVNVQIASSVAWLVGEHHSIPTGPMVMRIRYQGQDRNELVDGTITTDDSGQLIFQTQLDVYMDAPFLDPQIPLTELDHNMRSFRINDLPLQGPVTFLKDGRMQIEQRNTEKVVLSDITIDGDTLGGLGDILGLGPRTSMSLEIPKGELFLNYISPLTQQ
ncbi:hypothetical protein CF392_15790 [Tamilnaduibacter salinus]|uniref:Uncharacterized protein n=1 Tax=Tamilnaduibacter salinus TaxID=1484056 RepID=A0A2A2I050_9GAMM|nr:hypothetical protein [Tamilnaduibacter salinus]PAV24525.1 hypothetical protein CF392_15790 [Tamilnaduibacter salinus]